MSAKGLRVQSFETDREWRVARSKLRRIGSSDLATLFEPRIGERYPGPGGERQAGSLFLRLRGEKPYNANAGDQDRAWDPWLRHKAEGHMLRHLSSHLGLDDPSASGAWVVEPEAHRSTIITSDLVPWFSLSGPDGLVVPEDVIRSPLAVQLRKPGVEHVEVKTVRDFADQEAWEQDEPPWYVVVQVHGLWLFPELEHLRRAHVALCRSYGEVPDDRKFYVVERNQELVELLREMGSTFYRKALDGQLLSPDATRDWFLALDTLLPAHGRDFDEPGVVLGPEYLELTAQYHDACRVCSEAEREKQMLRSRVAQELARHDARTGTLPDVAEEHPLSGKRWHRTRVETKDQTCPACGFVVQQGSTSVRVFAPRR